MIDGDSPVAEARPQNIMAGGSRQTDISITTLGSQRSTGAGGICRAYAEVAKQFNHLMNDSGVW